MECGESFRRGCNERIRCTPQRTLAATKGFVALHSAPWLQRMDSLRSTARLLLQRKDSLHSTARRGAWVGSGRPSLTKVRWWHWTRRRNRARKTKSGAPPWRPALCMTQHDIRPARALRLQRVLDRAGHFCHLRRRHLGIDGQRYHLFHGLVGGREVALLEAESGVGRLQVDRDGVVDAGVDARGPAGRP